MIREVEELIDGYESRTLPAEAVVFAKELTRLAAPANKARARAFLFALSRLSGFALSLGYELAPAALLESYFVDRFLSTGTTGLSSGTVRTLRTNLGAVSRAVLPPAGPPRLKAPRHRAKLAYSQAEIDAHVRNALAQPTESRRMRATGLIALGAGAGLAGGDLRSVAGSDVIARSGGVVVIVGGGRPRTVPVIERYHELLLASAAYAGPCSIVGGSGARNVAGPLINEIAGGPGRIDPARLRMAWLTECAGRLGLPAFMAAAGLSCSQILGDLVAGLDAGGEERAIELLG